MKRETSLLNKKDGKNETQVPGFKDEIRALSPRFILSVVLIIMARVAKSVAAAHPDLVERYFSRGLYPFTSRIQTGITNLLPFSLYEMAVISLIAYGIYRLVRLVRSFFRRTFPTEALRLASIVVLLVSVVLFLFQFLWSLNNYRIPLKDQLGLDVRKASAGELADTYRALVVNANQTRALLDREDTVSNPDRIRYVLKTVWEGYKPLAQNYSIFNSGRVRVKGLLSSRIQTISGYSGVYNFLTGEANINIEPPLVTLPHTASHEVAHQMGITLEDEANYAGFLACKSHADPLFRYSGYLSALTYAGNALYEQSPDLYAEISSGLSGEIRSDQQEIRDFWNRHQNETASKIADRVNESYLKSNNQEEGMKSYGKFVDLLIADYLDDGSV